MRAGIKAILVGYLGSGVLAMGTLATSVPALAGEPGSGLLAASSWLSEVRLGAIQHDPKNLPLLGKSGTEARDYEKGFDFNAELLFPSPDNRLFRTLLSPRPHLGGMVNSRGKTNHAYAGLTWDYAHNSGLFIDGSFGFALHDGKLKTPRDGDGGTCSGGAPRFYCIDGWESLGSRILFREAVSLGYRFTPQHNVSFTVSHISNGGIFDSTNGGMNFAGLRYGYRLAP